MEFQRIFHYFLILSNKMLIINANKMIIGYHGQRSNLINEHVHK